MFREKMGHVTEWMGRVKLPRELKAKIRAYYAEVGPGLHGDFSISVKCCHL